MHALTLCPRCRNELRLPELAPGKRVRCPRCGEIFVPRVEEPEALPVADLAGEEVPASLTLPEEDPIPVLEEIKDRPSPRRETTGRTARPARDQSASRLPQVEEEPPARRPAFLFVLAILPLGIAVLALVLNLNGGVSQSMALGVGLGLGVALTGLCLGIALWNAPVSTRGILSGGLNGFGYLIALILLFVESQPLERTARKGREREPPPATALPGLLGYWPLDERGGAPAVDQTGRNPQAIVHNAQRVSGIRGSALHFGGAGQSLDLGRSTALNFAAGAPFTVAGWVRTTRVDGTIVSLRNQARGSPVLDIRVTRGIVSVEVRDDENEFGQHARIDGGQRVSDSEWHHFAVCRADRNRITLYVDGEKEGEVAALQSGGAITTDLRALGCELYWQRVRWGGANPWFEGTIDEFCVFGRALSLAEIKALAGVGPVPGGKAR